MPRGRTREPLTRVLIADFPKFLQAFHEDCPFKRYGQLEHHMRTIDRRRELGSVGAALADDGFVLGLHETLQAWGIGRQASHLKASPSFAEELRGRASDIAALEDLRLDEPALDAELVGGELWRLVESLGIVTNDAKIVAGTKALHHLLPDLVVPMDRRYTQPFFGWHAPQFQYEQADCFREAFAAFTQVARAVNPAQYVSRGWNSSLTKVVDNALVGMFRYAA